MKAYANQVHFLVAVDCIVFGFDGEDLKILVIKRALKPEINQWSLMGGFVMPHEGPNDAANRVLKQLTGLEGIYLEQLQTYGEPNRDPTERTMSVAYFALIDINKYGKQLNDDFHAEWFAINSKPKLIFDHDKMVEDARKKLRIKATLNPILFEMLPKKFTLPQLLNLFEKVNDVKIDERNFWRKIKATGLLIKLEEKDKLNSKRGAFYFKLDKKKYNSHLNSFLSMMPNLKI
jgi:8-oxo-dGTP diphosphatase